MAYTFILWLSEAFEELDSNTCTYIVNLLVVFHSLIVQIEKGVYEEKVYSNLFLKQVKDLIFKRH